MKEATAQVYLDELRPKKDGTCAVKIKITFNRKRKYFSTGISLLPDEFEKVMNAKRRTQEQKDLLRKINSFKRKAENVIEQLHVFTFDSFSDGFFDHRNISESVSFAFDKYISELKTEKRIGTAVSYECAKNSLENFKKNLTFAEITPQFLKKYENWMFDSKKSPSTIGIYLRSLKAIYNLQNIDKSLYPFGEGKNKYSIPTGRNIKKALSIEEVAQIYNYKAPENSTLQMAKDYWIFLYLCNGMNVKDFCLLKWENIDGDMLKYKRAKTERSKKDQKEITVAIKPQTREIINRWGQYSLSKQAYIFPHLENNMDAERQRRVYQQLTKIINKYMKRISKELGLNKNVTTYYARHSFATVLKRSGAKIEMISELLGHSSVHVTESYLDSFEKDQIQEQTDVLISGFGNGK